ncbi:MSMEG_1061 family FMN-dependent PPOX-type flavoprotein [Nocardioides renjunii]|uniref:MSMEG_1061 family FMN-dependent PPOX-type flavoprotein n=1 Tax=Nocardioides renjunii TaxID=3095075 RepID=UPI002AFF2983|nr:MSMEG_1061 family FMN-dependent PPOX-type flavoprotein [Nocardioides sp. S-34]WQQ24236.1 MSMEG_1061 family FMN-dependent PPOX-type flavoprotein [Nocardioides sp. S-34]
MSSEASAPAPSVITTPEQLEALLGTPAERARTKERSRLTDIDRAWLAASPFCVLSTADASGRCDASPKGDPAGSLVHVVDDTTIAIAERPGNRRVDGYLNLLENPHVGLLFVVPGRGDTLRVNGRGRLVTDAPFFDDLAVRGRRPVLALVVDVETLFFHCAKAFRRSRLWEPASWTPDAVPARAVIAHELEPVAGQGLAELEDYYRPENYDRGLY